MPVHSDPPILMRRPDNEEIVIKPDGEPLSFTPWAGPALGGVGVALLLFCAWRWLRGGR